MAEDIKTTLQFQADITEFKAAMQEANRAVKLANSEFKAASSGMDDWSGSTDGLAAKLRQLSVVHDAESRKLDVLQAAYQKAVAEQGEASAAAVNLKTQINNQQAVVNKTQKEFDAYAAKLDEVARGADGAADDVKQVGKAAKDAGDDARDGADGWTMMKDILADFISNTISAAVDAFVSLAESTREYRRDMAQLAQNASDAGQDLDAMTDVLADVAAVTGETDAAMEGLNMLMATGLDTTNLTLAAEAFAGAATKFDGLKFEALAEGLQETLAVGEAVGPFAELIERMGGDLEAFNAGLAACTTEAERQQYVMQWLNESGLQGVHDSYVQNNADLVEAEQAQFRYNAAMAQIGAAIEPINTALTNLGTTILEKVAPIVENIIQWVLDNGPLIEPIITGIAVALGVLAAALAIQGIISGVSKAFALLNTTMLANPFVLIAALIAGIVAAIVTLWNKSEAFRNFWKNLWDGIKKAFAVTVEWLGNAAKSIAGFFVSAWEGIKKAFSPFVGYFQQIWNTVKGIFSAVRSVLSGNFSDAWAAIKGIFAGWGGYFSGLWQNVKDIFANVGSWFTNIGSNIVEGIWSGISSGYNWIKEKITGWVGDVLGFFKTLFGIHSPSTVMRDEIGKMLGAGMAEGIMDSRKAVNGAVQQLSDAALDGLTKPRGPAPAAAAGKTINFYQTNNSPKALTRREIYRQTFNALAYAGGG